MYYFIQTSGLRQLAQIQTLQAHAQLPPARADAQPQPPEAQPQHGGSEFYSWRRTAHHGVAKAAAAPANAHRSCRLVYHQHLSSRPASQPFHLACFRLISGPPAASQQSAAAHRARGISQVCAQAGGRVPGAHAARQRPTRQRRQQCCAQKPRDAPQTLTATPRSTAAHPRCPTRRHRRPAACCWLPSTTARAQTARLSLLCARCTGRAWSCTSFTLCRGCTSQQREFIPVGSSCF